MAGRLLCVGLLLLCVTAACALSGCAGFGAERQPPETALPPQGPAAAGPLNLLASPLELLERGDLVRSAADAMCWLTGTEYVDGLCNRVGPATPGGTSALFEPAATGPGGSLADCAWAVYSLNLQDYAPGQQLALHWDAPLAEGTAYFGLSEWATGAWRWFAAGDGSFTPGMPAPEPYIRQAGPSAGLMLLAVVVTGTEPATLDWLRLGDPPATWERSWDNMGQPCSSVVDPENYDIYLFSQDFDLYYKDRPKVLTKLDASGSLVWSLETVLREEVEIGRCAVDSHGSVFFTGRLQRGGDRFMLLFKLSPQGEYEWGRTAAIHESSCGPIFIDAEDNIYLAGSLPKPDRPESAALAIKLNSLGEVQWTTTWDGDADEYLSGIVLTPGGRLLAAGSTKSFGSGEYDILIMELDPEDGLPQWNRVWGGSRDERCNSMALAGDGELWIAGEGASFYKHGLWLRYSAELDHLQAYSWGDAVVMSITDQALRIMPHGQLLRIIATTDSVARAQFVIDFDPGEEEIVAVRSWGIEDNQLFFELLGLPDGRTLLAGQWQESTFPYNSWHAEDTGWFHETFADLRADVAGASLGVSIELEPCEIEFTESSVIDNTATGTEGAMTLKVDF